MPEAVNTKHLCSCFGHTAFERWDLLQQGQMSSHKIVHMPLIDQSMSISNNRTLWFQPLSALYSKFAKSQSPLIYC